MKPVYFFKGKAKHLSLLTTVLFAFTQISPVLAKEETGFHHTKVEAKFLVPDLNQLPLTVLNALLSGANHPLVGKRGFVVQEYLPVTTANLQSIFSLLNKAEIGFGNIELQRSLLFPGRIQEIRLMTKSFLSHGRSHLVFQVTITGPGLLSASVLETSPDLSEVQKNQLKEIFTELRPRTSSMVRKIYFETVLTGPDGNLVFGFDHQPLLIEHDLYLANQNHRLHVLFNNAEVKIRGIDKEQSRLQATEWLAKPSWRPSYFGQDLTGLGSSKARAIARRGVPLSIARVMDRYERSNDRVAAEMVNEFRTWANSDVVQQVLTLPPAYTRVQIHSRILMQAEAFGFGPTAAIAELFPVIRERVENIAYIGEGHTHHLQRLLPYNKIYDWGLAGGLMKKKAFFFEVAKNYDVFITASDFEAATWAKEAGLKVIIYDPLTWYWKEIPQMVRQADLYISQNFLGVMERLKSHPDEFPETIVVPAIVSGLDSLEPSITSNQLLVNLGGLSNPYIDNSDLIVFAHFILGGVRESIEKSFDNVVFTGNRIISENLKSEFLVQTHQPHEVQQLLADSSIAIMTGGLGNIYEAAAMGRRVIWLPPANDSQGQQLKLLKQKGMIDAFIDWHHLFSDIEPIDYFAPQPEVLQKIAALMRRLAGDRRIQQQLTVLLNQAVKHIRSSETKPSLSLLVEQFGTDGGRIAADSLLQWIEQYSTSGLPESNGVHS